ncbi:MAG: hypothetical protein Q9219_001302 [cf. Caloplaca sp. 3 TL-2023]
MSIENPEAVGVDYAAFRIKVEAAIKQSGQKNPLDMRLKLLEAFMEKPAEKLLKKWSKSPLRQDDIWAFPPGSLTIVDLSDPWIDESAACTLFDVCLHLFLGLGPKTGKIVALDEAHTFMTGSEQSSMFTESLLSVIRKQRHTGTRVVIATQEPTISPKLLDLCSMTIVHRFTSPEWLQALKAHLAGVSGLGGEDSNDRLRKVFEIVVNLDVGKALLFSPSALLGSMDSGSGVGPSHGSLKAQKLGLRYMEVRIRNRLTEDSGRSIMAMPSS